jgi:hypothetical protein
MNAKAAGRVLLVAHQTAGSPELLAAVKKRARKGPAKFTLLVPSAAQGLHKIVDPQDHGDEQALASVRESLPKLERAAGSTVKVVIGDSNPLDAVQDAVNLGNYDEIIISTLPHKLSRWLRLDLPHKLEGLGLPITTVTASADHEAVAAS